MDAWFAPAPARRLAMLRCLVGAYATVFLLARAAHWLSPLAFDAAQFEPIGMFAGLARPLPAAALFSLLALTLAGSLAFTLGWRFALAGPCFAASLLALTTYRNCWSMIFHTDNLLALQVCILAFTRAADTLSLDARRRGQGEPPDSEAYGWPLRLSCLIIVLVYSLAAVAKLRHSHLAWLQPSWLRYWVAYDNLRKLELGHIHSPLGVWLLPHAWLFAPLSLFSVAVELLAPLALLGGRWALVWTVAACLFHWGVLALMAIAFPYPMSFVAFAPFYRLERLRNSWRPRPSAASGLSSAASGRQMSR